MITPRGYRVIADGWALYHPEDDTMSGFYSLKRLAVEAARARAKWGLRRPRVVESAIVTKR